jgi:hypothetical protein
MPTLVRSPDPPGRIADMPGVRKFTPAAGPVFRTRAGTMAVGLRLGGALAGAGAGTRPPRLALSQSRSPVDRLRASRYVDDRAEHAPRERLLHIGVSIRLSTRICRKASLRQAHGLWSTRIRALLTLLWHHGQRSPQRPLWSWHPTPRKDRFGGLPVNDKHVQRPMHACTHPNGARGTRATNLYVRRRTMRRPWGRRCTTDRVQAPSECYRVRG